MKKTGAKIAFLLMAALIIGVVLVGIEFFECAKSPYKWDSYCRKEAIKKANQGDVAAMLGLFYSSRSERLDEGVFWLKKAVESGEIHAYRLLISACGATAGGSRQELMNLAASVKLTQKQAELMIDESGNSACK